MDSAKTKTKKGRGAQTQTLALWLPDVMTCTAPWREAEEVHVPENTQGKSMNGLVLASPDIAEDIPDGLFGGQWNEQEELSTCKR